jgi:hypothetical protein
MTTCPARSTVAGDKRSAATAPAAESASTSQVAASCPTASACNTTGTGSIAVALSSAAAAAQSSPRNWRYTGLNTATAALWRASRPGR